MQDKVTIYEKPTCTTCRVVKKTLVEQGLEVEAVNYFDQPLSASELKSLLKRAGLKPSEAIRTNENSYRELIAGKGLSDDALIALMAAHPELIQRPIVVRGDKVVLARPVERLADLGVQPAGEPPPK